MPLSPELLQAIDPLDQIIEGAADMTIVLYGRHTPELEKRTRYKLERHLVDADKVGRIWISTARRLLRQHASKAAPLILLVLTLAGCATAEQVMARDDAICRSWSTTPGTEAYVACRSQLSLQEQITDMQRRNAALAMSAALLSR
jgi:hypothetical protein